MEELIEKLKGELIEQLNLEFGAAVYLTGSSSDREELEYVPGRFIVNQIARPRMACACCEAIVQAPLPSYSATIKLRIQRQSG